MTDKEKVIKAVICRRSAHKRCGNPCERTGACAYAAWIRDPDGEPYYPCYCDVERLCDDALALLREQEPVKPIPTGIEPNYNCGKCGLPIQQGYLFCPWCGRAVKWMPDRVKVIKALAHHKETAVCNGCPYAGDDDTPQGNCPVYDDALTLLREDDSMEDDGK